MVGHVGRGPSLLNVIDAPGGKVIGGGGPGGRVPSGRSKIQPPMTVSSQSRQKSKNQKLHGISVPPSVGFGSETEVVTGVIPATSSVVDEDGTSSVLVDDGSSSLAEVELGSSSLADVEAVSSSSSEDVLPEVLEGGDPLLELGEAVIETDVLLEASGAMEDHELTLELAEAILELPDATLELPEAMVELPEALSESEALLELELTFCGGLGIQVTTRPSDRVTRLLVVIPVGKVVAPETPEMIVTPSVVDVTMEGGALEPEETPVEIMVLIEPSVRVVTLGVSSTIVLVEPLGRVVTLEVVSAIEVEMEAEVLGIKLSLLVLVETTVEELLDESVGGEVGTMVMTDLAEVSHTGPGVEGREEEMDAPV